MWCCLEARFYELWRPWLLECLARVIGYTFENLKLWLEQIRIIFWKKWKNKSP